MLRVSEYRTLVSSVLCDINETLKKTCPQNMAVVQSEDKNILEHFSMHLSVPSPTNPVNAFHHGCSNLGWIKCWSFWHVFLLGLAIVNSTDNRSNISIPLCVLLQTMVNYFTIQPTGRNQRAYMAYHLTMETSLPFAIVTGSHLTQTVQHYP